MIRKNGDYAQRKALSRLLVYVARLLLGFLLLWSSLPKIEQPYSFLNSVFGYELLGPWGCVTVAVVIPFLELLTGIALLCGVCNLGALFASCGLLCIFLGVQIIAMVRGLEIACGCFPGAFDAKVGLWTILRTALVFIVAIIALATEYWQPLRSTAQEVPENPRKTGLRDAGSCPRDTITV